MNTSRYFKCKGCGTEGGIPLVMIPGWNGTCPKCKGSDMEHLFDYNPNSPEDRKAHPELEPTVTAHLL